MDILANLIAPSLTPFLLGVALDQTIKLSAKNAVADILSSEAPLSRLTTFVLSSFETMFGQLFSLRFFLFSFFYTTMFGTFALLLVWASSEFPFGFLYQLFFNGSNWPWLVATITLCFFVYILDCLSFAQTCVFINIISHTPRVLHVILILYADICLSLSIFLFLFPIGLAISFYIYDTSLSIDEQVLLWTERASPDIFYPVYGIKDPQELLWSFPPSQDYLNWRFSIVDAVGDIYALPFTWEYNMSMNISQEYDGITVDQAIRRVEEEFPNIRFFKDARITNLKSLFYSAHLPPKWIDFLLENNTVPRTTPDNDVDKNEFYTTHSINIGPFGQQTPLLGFYNFALSSTFNCIRSTIVTFFSSYCITSPGTFYESILQDGSPISKNVATIIRNHFGYGINSPPIRDTFLITTPMATAFFTSMWIWMVSILFITTRCVILVIRIIFPANWSFVDKIVDVRKRPFACVGFSISVLWFCLILVEMLVY